MWEIQRKNLSVTAKWYVILVLATIGDLVTTRIALDHGLFEGNPLVAAHLDRFVEMKIIYLIVILVFIYYIHKTREGTSWFPVCLSSYLMIAVVVWNTIQIYINCFI
jgi:hypothetical protein